MAKRMKQQNAAALALDKWRAIIKDEHELLKLIKRALPPNSRVGWRHGESYRAGYVKSVDGLHGTDVYVVVNTDAGSVVSISAYRIFKEMFGNPYESRHDDMVKH